MSLKARALPRVAKFTVLLMIALILPAPIASADSFSSWTSLATDRVGVQDWSDVTTTYDGSIVYASVQDGYLYKSADSGTTWSQMTSAGLHSWSSVATNDSGTIVVATDAMGYIWLSSDSGVSWNSKASAGSRSWASVAISASGAVIAATYAGSTLWLSTNYGSNWSSVTPGGTWSRSIAISGDGTKIAFIGNDGIYLSSNTGGSFTKNSGFMSYYSTDRRALSMSRDGQKIAAVTSTNSDPKIHFTSNFGGLWETSTAQAAATNFTTIKVSGDSNTIVIGSFISASYITYNNGALWTSASGNGSWTGFATDYSGTRWYASKNSTVIGAGVAVSPSGFAWISKTPGDGLTKAKNIAVSSNGQKIAVSLLNGSMWVSSDGGSTWISPSGLSAATDYTCLAMSADGSKIVAGGSSSPVVKSVDGGATFTQTYSSNTTVYGCAVSADGKVVVFADYNAGIVIATDGGVLYTNKLSNTFNATTYSYRSVAINSDGSKIAVVPTNAASPIIVSSDTGTTWSSTGVNASTNSNTAVLRSSADGSVLIAASSGGGLPKISKDWGANWSTLPSNIGSSFINGIGISGDGGVIVMGQSIVGGTLFQSIDAGASFSAVSGAPTGIYRALAVNRDRSVLIAGIDSNPIKKAAVALTIKANFSGITLSATNLFFRSQVTLTATISAAGGDGLVTFFANGKKIAGCVKVATSTLVATCNWKPAARGSVTLSAVSFPTGSNFLSSSTTLPVVIGNRTGRR